MKKRFVLTLSLLLVGLSACEWRTGGPANQVVGGETPQISVTLAGEIPADVIPTSVYTGSETSVPQAAGNSTTPEAAVSQVVVNSPVPEVEKGYPATPEEVVGAFLNAYQQDQSAMQQYLSAELVANLPGGGPAALLQVSGELEGFMIRSGSLIPEPAEALVEVAILSDGQEVVRTFRLARQDKGWVIQDVN